MKINRGIFKKKSEDNLAFCKQKENWLITLLGYAHTYLLQSHIGQQIQDDYLLFLCKGITPPYKRGFPLRFPFVSLSRGVVSHSLKLSVNIPFFMTSLINRKLNLTQ